MTPLEIRSAFKAFVGATPYCKFVRAINHHGRVKARLRAWQEMLWRPFVATLPISLTAAEVVQIFSVCEVHGCPVRSSPVQVESRVETDWIRQTPTLDDATETEFPYAIGKVICDQCASARQAWLASHTEFASALRCVTTYEDFCRRWFSELCDRPEIKRKIEKQAADIKSKMESGDELWEWDLGNWHRMSGAAGLAIVRDGVIVEQWCEVRS